MRERGIASPVWPLYSPDLNPIENLWAILKNKSELRALPRGEGTLDILFNALKEEWQEISVEILSSLIESMSRRLAEVKEKKGWYTKY